jgi:HPt (histidine-containing phosphotransfer) domain-containing protein
MHTIIPAGMSPGQASLRHLAEQGLEGELAAEIIQSFLDMVPDLLSELDCAMQTHDLPKITRVAHSLRGGCANIGLEPLAAALRELETSAVTQPEDLTATRIRGIKGQFQECTDSVRIAISV